MTTAQRLCKRNMRVNCYVKLFLEKKKKGKWERWSEWSACNMDCKMARTRLSTEENGVLKTQRKKCKETCKGKQ